MSKVSTIILILYFLTKNINVISNNKVNNNFILNENKNVRNKRATLINFSPQWTSPISYSIQPRCGLYVADIVRSIEKDTCLRFSRVFGDINKMIKYVCGITCRIRNQKPNRKIIETAQYCRTRARLIQLTLNALGLIYEERRPDRDKYVIIKRENIIVNERYKFPPLKSSDVYTTGLRYDFGSIMHNGRHFESQNGRLTIVSKNSHYLKTYGQTKEMSFNDIKSLNVRYCRNSCQQKLNCTNYGYTDPNNCGVCKCPSFYTGTLCENLMPSLQVCGTTELAATNVTQTLTINGTKTCIYKIVAPEKLKVGITIVQADLPVRDICPPNVGLEVKFLYDKSVAGARFCGLQRNIKFNSVSKELTMKYVGLENENFVNIDYIQVDQLSG
ncbi:Astacin-like metalloendopeptidase [Strongyloides ratti]|uniref:Metalloendopeptidase n=1 Tax=Strongyloides ratti TaxID=34506 RepID=A0A090LPD4_STRRB|nr:Astacin-like metalloendopeptidase [Strongyloides ratti]CEF70054.1 Astacin-like metalloendopeptidase [Strongyloides ratti]